MELNSDLLRTFVTIAQCGNLTEAAARLHRTQSAISVQLRKLEADLNARLFSRTPKGMTLTHSGERLLPTAKAVLAELGRARSLFAEPLAGHIRVGIPDDFEDTILERALAEFSERHPGVHVLANSGCTSGFPAAVNEGLLDVAVCSGPENTAGDVFMTEATVWAAGHSGPPPLDGPVPLAILDRNCWWRDLPIDALEKRNRTYLVAFKSSSFSSLKSAIRAGFAIGVLPESCLENGMRRLAPKDGFPELPASKRSILVRPEAPRDVTDAMAEALLNARL
ncbi:MAG: LysR family transcriptional regulator [Pseudomonadota bacterium]